MSEELKVARSEVFKPSDSVFNKTKIGHLDIGDYFFKADRKFRLIYKEGECCVGVTTIQDQPRAGEFKAQDECFIEIKNPMNHAENI